MLHIQEEFNLSESVSEVVVGAAKLGAVLGTFLGGALMLYYGRRPAIAADSLFFIIGPAIMAGAWNVAGLIIGRFIVGMGIGVSAVVVTAYLGEVAPAKSRGRIVELYEVMLCLGMMTSALINAALDDVTGNWRWMVGVPAIPAVLMSCKCRMRFSGGFRACLVLYGPRSSLFSWDCLLKLLLADYVLIPFDLK